MILILEPHFYLTFYGCRILDKEFKEPDTYFCNVYTGPHRKKEKLQRGKKKIFEIEPRIDLNYSDLTLVVRH